jgi:hypothetical protein
MFAVLFALKLMGIIDASWAVVLCPWIIEVAGTCIAMSAIHAAEMEDEEDEDGDWNVHRE